MKLLLMNVLHIFNSEFNVTGVIYHQWRVSNPAGIYLTWLNGSYIPFCYNNGFLRWKKEAISKNHKSMSFCPFGIFKRLLQSLWRQLCSQRLNLQKNLFKRADNVSSNFSQKIEKKWVFFFIGRIKSIF